jgi:cholesterol 7-dehydrogenase
MGRRLRRAFAELVAHGDEGDGAGDSLLKRRRERDYPPPYPHGWYRIANSSDVASGELLRISCLGQRMVLFRGERNGEIGVVDSYCPHQGADISVGGEVKGDCIRCPFHHWTFDAHGHVTQVPNVKRLPRVDLDSWPARESNGMIFVYYGGPERAAPPYELAEHADIDSGRMLYRGEHCAGEVNMHLIEFAENSVDFEHFAPVHGGMLVPWTQLRVPFMDITHRPTWEIDEQHGYISHFYDHASLQAFGHELPRSSAHASITFFGPGSLVWFRFSLPEVGDIQLFQTHTPVEPLRQRIYFRWYAEKQVPRLLVSYVVGSWISQWQGDIAIWENKIYRRKPKLSSADGPVARMRSWYQQFYPQPAVNAQISEEC